MKLIVFCLTGYFSGAVPYSVWLGKLFFGKDVRNYGTDGNPGTTNAFKAGGVFLGITVMLLDYSKGAIPVAMAIRYGVGGPLLIPVLLAPILGHCFSIFLRFKGGKGVATTFGSWSGLTVWEAPLVLGSIMGTMTFLPLKLPDSVIVVVSMVGLLVYFVVSKRYESYYIYFWIINLLLLLFTHRSEFRILLDRGRGHDNV